MTLKQQEEEHDQAEPLEKVKVVKFNHIPNAAGEQWGWNGLE